jgi:hypothetical protein
MSISHRRRGGHKDASVDAVAGNWLLDRRALLGRIVLGSAAGTGVTASRMRVLSISPILRAATSDTRSPAP